MMVWTVTSVLLVVAVAAAVAFYCKRRSDAQLQALLGGENLKSYPESVKLMERELSRARRHNRPLSIALLKIDDQLEETPGQNRTNSFQSFSLQLIGYLVVAKMIHPQLRDYDILAHHPELNQYVVLLAECNLKQARLTTRRIIEHVKSTTRVHLKSGVAEFPTHGFVLEDLLEQAQKDAVQSEFQLIVPEKSLRSGV